VASAKAAPRYDRVVDEDLLAYYALLHRHFGPQDWWPARTRLEVMVGAVLVQNTSWRNVEYALQRLRAARRLSLPGLRATSAADLGRLIRSSGFWRPKARCLKALVALVDQQHGGRLDRMFRTPTAGLRAQLLALPGVGPETADNILLYAGGHATFVVDAYTRRVLDRHNLGPEISSAAAQPLPYETLRGWFEARLPRQAALYNEFHALLVAVGKQYCHKKTPCCRACPLRAKLP